MTFENASRELKEIIEKLESGSLSLAESTTLFERGLFLSKFCYNEVESAKGKISVIIEELDALTEKEIDE